MGHHNGAGHESVHHSQPGGDGIHPGQGGEHPVSVWADHAAQPYAPHTNKTPCSDAGSSRGGSTTVAIGDGNTGSVSVGDGNKHSVDGGGTNSTDGGGTPPTDGGGQPPQPPNQGESSQPRHDEHHRHRDVDAFYIPPFVYPVVTTSAEPSAYISSAPRGLATPANTLPNSARETTVTR